MKRGGGVEVVALEETTAATPSEFDDLFRQEWIRRLFTVLRPFLLPYCVGNILLGGYEETVVAAEAGMLADLLVD